MEQEPLRRKLDRRLSELKAERALYEQDWRDVVANFLPWRARWWNTPTRNQLSDGALVAWNAKKGKAHRTKSLINSKPTKALRTWSSGLMSSVTNETKDWFRMTVDDQRLSDVHAVSEYLSELQRILVSHFSLARVYRGLGSAVYPDLGMLSTGAMWEEEARAGVGLRFETLTPGEYYLDVNADTEVDTCFRVRPMTVRQMAQEFGEAALSEQARRAFDAGRFNAVVIVIQAVLPREDLEPGRLDAKGKPWASYWFEQNEPTGKLLRESGYNEFPVIVFRSGVRSGDVYGVGGPGQEALGDAKALQHDEEKLASLVDKSADPPMRGDESLRKHRVSLLPADITYTAGGATHKFEPAMEVQPQSIAVLREYIRDRVEQIQESFDVELWRMLMDDERAQPPTAYEVQERKREMMLQLGPLLGTLTEGLRALILRSLAILDRQGQLPPMPDELRGQNVNIEFISMLHQAWKMAHAAAVREAMAVVQELATMGRTDALDKLNVDAIVDEFIAMLGVKPNLMLSADEVAKLREARLQNQQAEQQGQAMLAATQGAKNLGATDPQRLQDVASMLPAAAAAQGGVLQ